ncbi:MAG TPA: lycopene cyclase domain-containing protein, partial [Ferruginibacter sp.]|nr:lycopene cyclase domain-containing protein [Ferruginibacter sp.]
MNAHYTYFLILALSLAGPLALSFDSKVGFYKKWRYLFPAMIIPALLYIGWDMWFTHQQIWSFNPDYISGIHIYNLPIEEVLFFFVVPYCCVFIYECIRAYFPNIRHTPTLQYVFYALGLALFVTGIVYADRAYTAYTFLLLSLL